MASKYKWTDARYNNSRVQFENDMCGLKELREWLLDPALFHWIGRAITVNLGIFASSRVSAIAAAEHDGAILASRIYSQSGVMIETFAKSNDE